MSVQRDLKSRYRSLVIHIRFPLSSSPGTSDIRWRKIMRTEKQSERRASTTTSKPSRAVVSRKANKETSKARTANGFMWRQSQTNEWLKVFNEAKMSLMKFKLTTECRGTEKSIIFGGNRSTSFKLQMKSKIWINLFSLDTRLKRKQFSF